jgi:hypothetical protein
MRNARVIVCAILLMAFCLCTACTSTQQASISLNIYQAALGGDSAARITGNLLAENVVDKAQAESIYDGLVISYNLQSTVLADLNAPPTSTTNLVQDTANLATAVNNISTELSAVNLPASLKKFTAHRLGTASSSLGDVSQILQIAIELGLDSEPFINALFNVPSVTPDQISSAMASENTDIGALAAQINASATTKALGQ